MEARLRIADVTIALRSEHVALRFVEPAARFAVPEDGEAEVTIDVAAVPSIEVPSESPIFDSGAVWKLYPGNRIVCSTSFFGEHPYKSAVFDDTFTRGEVSLRQDVAATGLQPLDYPLDEVLMAHLLGRGRGVELHACGIIDREGRGRLFAGQSGAGKTTTARLWAGTAVDIVSDDRVIVREHNGTLWMYGTPWHGEAELSSARVVPLAGVYLLTQAAENALRDLTSTEAVARLFGCTFPLFHDAGAIAFTLQFLERIAALVPVRELQFRRDAGAVEVVQRVA